MSRYNPVRPADIRYTVKHMGKGVPLKACALARGVCYWTLRNHMNREGLPTRRSVLPQRKTYIDYPPTDRTMQIVRMVNKHRTQTRAAELLGITPQAVFQHMRRYNLHV